MFMRNSRVLFALVVAVSLARADFTLAQGRASLEAPLQLASLEWWVASNDLIVRGVVVDVTPDEIWNIVTLEVKETIKGTKAERVKFVVHKFDTGDTLLADSKKSKAEQLWVLKRQEATAVGEAPHREKIMARHKVSLHAPFVPGRPGEPDLPMIPLNETGESKIKFLTLDLKLHKTIDGLVKAIRAIAAESGEACACESEPLRSYLVAVPKEIADGTGFSRTLNQLIAPMDERLEKLARRLVLTPGEFVTNCDTQANRQLLRLEGVKTLRQFQSETNLAIIRTWLDDPMSNSHYKSDRTQASDLVPSAPKVAAQASPVVPNELARVPEIHFQQPLTKALNTTDAQLHTAITIEGVNVLNKRKTDAFIETMMQKRSDLAGLSFAMGEHCRMKADAGRNFVAALELYRKTEAAAESKKTEGGYSLVKHYEDQANQQNINSSASVATLMQVLGHEDAKTRLELVEFLDSLSCADSTRALARMAIFSQEANIRAAAVKSLKLRRDSDYTEVLVTGLKYPWPEVAQRASEAIVQLGRGDLIPNLVELLETPDPRAPQVQDMGGKKVTVVRELVKLNHHHNCLLCHAPANGDKAKNDPNNNLEGLTAQVPVPSESMVAYYRPSQPDILVRFDVTYLRQDFSMKLPVANADPWPELQRYDFLVRTREVNEKEATAYQELLQVNRPEASPYRLAALTALRQLTGNEPAARTSRKSGGL